MQYTKRQARELLRAKNDAELARFFDTYRSTVSQWHENKPLPAARQGQLALVTKAHQGPKAKWRSRPDKGSQP